MRKLSLLLVLLVSSLVFIGVRVNAVNVPLQATFSGAAFATGQNSPTVLAVGDFNSDGAFDVAVTSAGGMVVFKGQVNGSGVPNGALGNVQTSTLASCGGMRNVALGYNRQFAAYSPILHGASTAAGQGFHVDRLPNAWYDTTATCQTTSGYTGAASWLAVGNFIGSSPSSQGSDGVLVNGTDKIFLAPGHTFGTYFSNFAQGTALLPNSLTGANTVTAAEYTRGGAADVLAGAGSNVVLFPNQKTGDIATVFTMATASNISVGATVKRIAVSDATGDGKVDIVATTDASIVVITGNGTDLTGTQGSVSMPSGFTANSTAIADFNGDGLPDLAVAATGTGAASNSVILIYYGLGLNGGVPTYSASPDQIQIGSNAAANLTPIDVVAKDMNRDGRMDLVVATQTDNNVWVLTNGTPRLVTANLPSMSFFAVKGSPSPAGKVVAIGTSDSGAVPTLSASSSLAWVAASVSGSNVTIAPDISQAPGNGTGTFYGLASVSGLGYGRVVIPYSVTIVEQSGTMLRGGQSGTMVTTITGPGGSGGPLAGTMAVGDFNGDGKPDMAGTAGGQTQCGNAVQTCFGIYLRTADDTAYTAPVPSRTVSENNTAITASPSTGVGDFNRDGKLDVAMVNSSGDVVVAFGDGAGNLSGSNQYRVGSATTQLLVADVNGDGAPDIVVTATANFNNAVGGLWVLLNDGAGGFSPANLRPNKTYLGVAVADFNGDGIPDIAATNQTQANAQTNPPIAADYGLEIFLGLGGGTFAAPYKVSFFIANGCVGTVTQCTRPTQQNPNPARPSSGLSAAIVAGDFNGDGRADLAFLDVPDTASPLGGAIVVALASVDAGHNVTFNLSSQGTILTSAQTPPNSLMTGDVDGDGRLDLVWSKVFTGGGTGIRLGNGDGTFTYETTINHPVESYNQQVVLADMDGDGRLDIVGQNQIGEPSGAATTFWMGAKATPTITVAGLPTSAVNATTANVTFQGTMTFPPMNFVRGTAATLSFYDPFPTLLGTAVPASTGGTTMVATITGTATVGQHDFTARFAGDGRILATNGTTPSPLHTFSWSQQPPANTAPGAAMATSPSVLYTNSFPTNYTGPIAFALDHGTFSPGVVTSVTGSSGFASLGTVKVANAGTYYLFVMGENTLLKSNNFNITGGPATHLAINNLNVNVTAGAQQTVQIQALDASNATANAYTGTVHFTSSDGIAVLPADYTFVAGDNSVKSVNVTFKTAGARSLTATDTVTASITGTANTTVGPGAVSTVTLNSPAAVATNTAFATLSATVKDSFNNPISGATVTFATTVGAGGSDGAFTGGATATTDAAGVATKVITANAKAGGFTVTAAAGAVTSAASTLTINPGPAATLSVIAGNSQSTAINTAFPQALQVKAVDSSANPVAGFSITFASPANGASCGYPSAVTTQATTDSSGIASVPCTANATTGTFSVTASGTGVAPVSITLLTNSAAAAASITVVGGNAPVTGTVNTAFPSQFQVVVKDASLNPVPNISVTFTAPSSGASGTFTGFGISATVLTDGTGTATAPPFVANTIAGSYVITVTIAALFEPNPVAIGPDPQAAGRRNGRRLTANAAAPAAGPAASATISLINSPGAAASIVKFAGNNQSTSVGSAFLTALAVKVTDQYANSISGAQVTFTAPASGASGTFAANPVVLTASNGVGTAPTFTANSTIGGPYGVSASVSGLAPVTFSETNTIGAPSSLTIFSGNNQSVAIGGTFASALSVKVTDVGNNPLAGVQVVFAPPGSGASGTFTGSATVTTNGSGIATAPAYTANTVAGTNGATATANGLPVTFSLTNLAGPAAVITPSGTPQSVLINTIYAPLSVKIADASNNPVSGLSVVFAAPASGAGGTFAGSNSATVVTGADGRATAPTFTANAATGGFAVTATSGALSTNFSMANTFNPGAFITITGGDGQSAQLGAAFGTPLAVRVTNLQGGPAANVLVTFTMPSAGTSAAFQGGNPLVATVITDAQGMANSPLFAAGALDGYFSAIASAPGATGTIQAAFTLRVTRPSRNIEIAPGILNFEFFQGLDTPGSQLLTVTAPDGGLTFAVDQPWLKAVRVPPPAPATFGILVTVDPTALSPGTYYGSVTIAPGVSARVVLVVRPRPVIQAGVPSLTFQYIIGQPVPAEQPLTIYALTRNVPFTFAPVVNTPAGASWLRVTGSGSITASVLKVGVVPGSLETGTYQGLIHIGAIDSANGQLDVAVTLQVNPGPAPPAPLINAIVNAASSQEGAASTNEIMSLYGSTLGCSSTPKILVDGTAVQVFSSTATQVNFLMPSLTGKAKVAVQFVCGSITSGTFTLMVAPVAPGIFLSGATRAAAFNQDFTYNGAVSPDVAAVRGSVVMLFGTGFGELNGPAANGLQWTVQPVTVTVGGAPAQVLFAGAAPGWPGLNQFNVVIPAGAPTGSAVPFIITVGTVPQSGATLAIR